MIETSRRSFIRGAVASLIAAPAIVRAGSLMPVKVMPDDDLLERLIKFYESDRARFLRTLTLSGDSSGEAWWSSVDYDPCKALANIIPGLHD